jgi:hypothetical protein
MAAGRQSPARDRVDTEDSPQIEVCESAPGKVVFLESGNTDGWIASDCSVDVER